MEDFITLIEWMKLVSQEMELLTRESEAMLKKVQKIGELSEELEKLTGK